VTSAARSLPNTKMMGLSKGQERMGAMFSVARGNSNSVFKSEGGADFGQLEGESLVVVKASPKDSWLGNKRRMKHRGGEREQLETNVH